MATLMELVNAGRIVETHRPWPRAMIDDGQWRSAIARLADGQLTLLALWAESEMIHMALLDEQPFTVAVLSLNCRAGRYPSVGASHPPAIRLERAVRDLCGLEAEGASDHRPWLDHGRWGLQQPLGRQQVPARSSEEPYSFLPSEGDGLHQIPVGPVHAGIIEPGHFRFTCGGETVVRLEERLGYVHRGVEALMTGAGLEQAARLAGRVSGDSTVAYAIAFSRAVESALGIEAPGRAAWLRALMAELERIANHLGDIGAICNDASFALMHAHCGVLRERTLRAADAAFGHRLMRDCVVPGGVAADVRTAGVAQVRALLEEIRSRLPHLAQLYDQTASLQDRTVGTGILRPELARQYGAGGFVGRASGRQFDARRVPGYEPYGAFRFDVATLGEGDVNARVWIRIREVEQSMALVEQILGGLPGGSLRIAPPEPESAREGAALVEGFRGDIFVWLRLGDHGRVARCHLRDPSWFQWPLLEAAIENNIVADFPICNKSFNCSYSGHDL
jgi:Ni,Fe-hydrogenase III large subunit